MLKINKILVPIDFSEVSHFIVKWAKDFAQKLEAEVLLTFVLEDLSSQEGVYANVETLKELQEILMNGAKQSMEEFVKKYFSDFPKIKTIIEKGDIAEKIIEIGRKEKADLIVIGTHGRKGLDKILFGSVAERVIQLSPIPVVSLNPYRMEKNL
ncbi:MAG: universal stress protein [Thermodesulfobacteriota bacterium]|nr:MAG: universal stress protein [Thermodesulfobacteriota bacterium]RLG13083.1 MAG: universal stress protein [Candidatus Pacearchaeota archaeon]